MLEAFHGLEFWLGIKFVRNIHLGAHQNIFLHKGVSFKMSFVLAKFILPSLNVVNVCVRSSHHRFGNGADLGKISFVVVEFRGIVVGVEVGAFRI